MTSQERNEKLNQIRDLCERINSQPSGDHRELKAEIKRIEKELAR